MSSYKITSHNRFSILNAYQLYQLQKDCPCLKSRQTVYQCRLVALRCTLQHRLCTLWFYGGVAFCTNTDLPASAGHFPTLPNPNSEGFGGRVSMLRPRHIFLVLKSYDQVTEPKRVRLPCSIPLQVSDNILLLTTSVLV